MMEFIDCDIDGLQEAVERYKKTNNEHPHKILVSRIIIARFVLLGSEPPEVVLNKDHYLNIGDIKIQMVFDTSKADNSVYLLSEEEYKNIFPERWNKLCTEKFCLYKSKCKQKQIHEEILKLQREERKMLKKLKGEPK